MQDVVFVGTGHTIQLGQVGDSLAFEKRLSELCNEFEVAAIGEEMSAEVVARRGSSETIGVRVARFLSLLHIYCDPPSRERQRIGVTSVQEVQVQAVLDAWTDEQKLDRLAAHCAAVEGYWLARLRKINAWPVLFICGANHVSSFTRVLQTASYSVFIADADWGA